MRLFLYYALHSFKNQIKKLFHTWILIFIVICLLVGGGLGLFLGTVLPDEEEDVPVTEEIEDERSLSEITGIEDGYFIELVASGVLLLIFFWYLGSADKSGSKIFLPADAVLLFSSPMTPQSVLGFRTVTQLGTTLLASIYLAFQIPNLVFNLGMGLDVVLVLFLTWILTIAVSTLLRILVFSLAATYPNIRKFIRPVLYAALLLIAAAYFLHMRATALPPLKAAVSFFCSRESNYIPFWGWIKAFCHQAVSGSWLSASLYLGATLLGSAGLLFAIIHMKPDFYEDALKETDSVASVQAEIKDHQESGIVIVRRAKDRDEKITRDGFRHGHGASVYFFKAMYNRFRFAKFGLFTKTTVTYSLLGLGTAALCRFIIHTDTIYPVIFVLGVMVFFRSLGNPFSGDISLHYFTMIPESAGSKLFWSVLGGTADCFLDMLPALLFSPLLLGVSPLPMLVWIPFLLSIDFFSSVVGTFIGQSVSASAGNQLKQLIQILFIYFGLVPDIILIVLGFVFNFATLSLIGATVINLGIGALFFGLTAMVLEP